MKLPAFAFVAFLALSGCSVEDPGPEVRCRDCPPVLEPGSEITFTLRWTEEPCDVESMVPGITSCREVDIESAITCDGPCEVTQDPITSDWWWLRPLETGPLEATIRLTRRDDGTVHEVLHSFEVAHADRLELDCERDHGGDCRVRDSSTSLGTYTLTLRGHWGEQPVALDLDGLSASEELTSWLGDSDGYEASVGAGEARIVTVTSAGGASARFELPAY